MPVKLRRFGVALSVAAFWLAVWSLGVYVANQSLLMPLPYPWDVVETLGHLVGQTDFWSVVAQSLWRILSGFLMAVAVGAGLAVLTTRFAFLHALFSPVLSLIRAVPVASFIFLVYLWVQADAMPSLIAFLMVVPLVWENLRQGILHTDQRLLEMARVFRMNRRTRLWRIHLPSVRPYLQAALTTGFGFAWKSGIAAEVICRPSNSIGDQIGAVKSGIPDNETIFAWTAVVVVLSVVLEWLLRRLVRREVAE
ncbi:MAG: ABC transporter permease subunit [Ruminococcaceae bacterium]|nr:ABC transporter permease subunit [Oscillospiraceae bacterium]